MLALRQWGEKYGVGIPSNPVLCDARDGMPIAEIAIHAHDGRRLHHTELEWREASDVGKPEAEYDDYPVKPQLNVLR